MNYHDRLAALEAAADAVCDERPIQIVLDSGFFRPDGSTLARRLADGRARAFSIGELDQFFAAELAPAPAAPPAA